MTDDPAEPALPEPSLPDPAAVLGVALPAPAQRAQPVATDVALVAIFAAFVAVCAIVPAIPTGTGVPITLQTFGVVVAGLVLGARRGSLAVLLYLAVGLAGVPVFAGWHGGSRCARRSQPSVVPDRRSPSRRRSRACSRALRAQRRARGATSCSWRAASTATALTIHPLGIAGIVMRRRPDGPARRSRQEPSSCRATPSRTSWRPPSRSRCFAHYPDLLRRRR